MALSNQDRNANQKFTTEIVAPGGPTRLSSPRPLKIPATPNTDHCVAIRDAKEKEAMDAWLNRDTDAWRTKVGKDIALLDELIACQAAALIGIQYTWFGGLVSNTYDGCVSVFDSIRYQNERAYQKSLSDSYEQLKKDRDTISEEFANCLKGAAAGVPR